MEASNWSFNKGLCLVVWGVVAMLAGGTHASPPPATNMLAWFQADAGLYTTATGATASGHGDPVGRWEDQSGNGYHIRRTAGAGGNRPTLYTDTGPGGMPAVYFDVDGSNIGDYLLLSSTGGFNSLTRLPTGTTIGTVFIVFKPTDTINKDSSGQYLISFDANPSSGSIILGQNSGIISNEVISARDATWTGTWQTGTSSSVTAWASATDSVSNAHYTSLSLTHATDTFEIRSLMGDASLTNASTTHTPDGFAPFGIPATQLALLVGGYNYAAGTSFQGDIAEIILYTTELSAIDRSSVEAYLAGKYGLPSTFYLDSTGGSDSNDGRTTTSAWKNIRKITGTTFNPGDKVLFKRGETWRPTSTQDNFNFPSSGTADLPITVSAYGDTEDPLPLFIGTRVVPRQEWGVNIDGVYSWTLVGSVVPRFVAEDDTLIPHATSSACLNGNWYYDSATTVLYYRPTDGSWDTEVVSRAYAPVGIGISDRSHLNISHLKFMLQSSGVYGTATNNGITHVKITNNEFSMCAGGVRTNAANTYANSHITIADNTFDHCGQGIGIYGSNTGKEISSNYTITGNTITDHGFTVGPELWGELYGATDMGGIGTQHLNDSVITHNKIIKTDHASDLPPAGKQWDGAIGLFTYTSPVSNNIIAYNWIENAMSSGIYISGATAPVGNNKIYYNVIRNCAQGPGLSYAPYVWGGLSLAHSQTQPSLVYNNLIVGCDASIVLKIGANGYTLKNNLSYEPWDGCV